jgi:hypothetical protein
LGGGIYSNINSTLSLNHVQLDSNFAGTGANGDSQNNGSGGNGGGLATSSATVTIQNSQIANNWAGDAGDSSNTCTAEAGSGGGIYLNGSTAQVSNTTISANLSGMGGDSAGNAQGCAGGSGGGVFAAYVNLTIADSTIENNYTQTGGTGGGGFYGGAAGGGGGIYSGGSLTLTNVTIDSNHTAGGRAPTSRGGDGGGLWCSGTLNATDLTVTDNTTGDGAAGGAQGYHGGHGGGLYASDCNGTISNSEIRGNHTGNGGAGTEIGSYGGYGGGLYFTNSYTALNLVDVSIEANYTGNGGAAPEPGYGGRGGGIYTDAPMNLTRVTLTENYTGNGGMGGEGGGFYGYGTIVNSTISGNHTGSPGASGGGLLASGLAGGQETLLQSSTVAFNQASGSGGGVRSQYPWFYARNSILAYNGASGGSPDCSGSMQSQGYNLVGSTAGCAITLGVGDLLNTNPYLFALADNGGPTKTHAFQNYSPVLDRANPATPGSGGNACPATDQRGEPRADLRCDIGAYEALPSGGTVVVAQPLAAGATVSFGPGMAAMTLNSADPITGTVQRSDSDPIGFPPGYDELGVTWTITVTEGIGGRVLAPLAFDLDLSLCFLPDEVDGLNPGLLQMYRKEASAWTPLGGAMQLAQPCVKRSSVTLDGVYALAVPPEQVYLPAALK